MTEVHDVRERVPGVDSHRPVLWIEEDDYVLGVGHGKLADDRALIARHGSTVEQEGVAAGLRGVCHEGDRPLIRNIRRALQ